MANVANVYTMFNRILMGIPVKGNRFKNISKSVHAKKRATAPTCHAMAVVQKQLPLLCPTQNMIVKTNNGISTKFSKS